MARRKRKQQSAREKRRRTARQGKSLTMEKLNDRLLLAADVIGELVESKETPAEISSESSQKSDSKATTKEQVSQKSKPTTKKIPAAKAGEYQRISWLGNPLLEKSKATVDDDDSTDFPMSEWKPSVKPTLPIKMFDGPTIELNQEVEADLPHVNLEQFEGLERLEENLLEDVLAERSAETERYGKIARDSFLDELDKPASLMDEAMGDAIGQPNAESMTRDSVLGYGMASDLSVIDDPDGRGVNITGWGAFDEYVNVSVDQVDDGINIHDHQTGVTFQIGEGETAEWPHNGFRYRVWSAGDNMFLQAHNVDYEVVVESGEQMGVTEMWSSKAGDKDMTSDFEEIFEDTDMVMPVFNADGSNEAIDKYYGLTDDNNDETVNTEASETEPVDEGETKNTQEGGTENDEEGDTGNDKEGGTDSSEDTTNSNGNNSGDTQEQEKPSDGKTDPGRPAPDDTGSDHALPARLAQKAFAEFKGEYAQQPWVKMAGQPVPDGEDAAPISVAAANLLFAQLARQNWNPMIVQPGPDGDMESNYVGMKEVPRSVGAMKMAMAGQPRPEDSEWGAKNGPSGPVTFNPQPVTTQRDTDVAEEAVEEVHQRKG